MSIRELREAVEAGTIDETLFGRVFGEFAITASMAFHDSIDATKALHEAMLPGWRVVDVSELNGHGLKGKWLAELASWTEEKCVRVLADNEARARLIAILRALEEEGRG